VIRVERDGAVATVTVDRQDALNALDPQTLTELRDRLAEVAADASARVVVLTGAGERAFVAGADIKAMSAMDMEAAQAWGDLGHETALLLETMAKPTIAAVNGSRSAAAASSRSPATSVSPRPLRASASPRSRSASSPAGAGRSGSRRRHRSPRSWS
jgi:1,4-dihydroxy-2-naphthoyl-CoA synthase